MEDGVNVLRLRELKGFRNTLAGDMETEAHGCGDELLYVEVHTQICLGRGDSRECIPSLKKIIYIKSDESGVGVTVTTVKGRIASNDNETK